MMANKACPKVGIYFSHYECFGHTSRVTAVGEVFKKRFPDGSLFFIQAGLQQRKARIDRLGPVYTLPGAFMDRRNFKEPVYGAGADAGGRTQACEGIMAKERPDLLMTEFFPFGREECRHELIPVLAKASAQGLHLLGIVGYPLLTGKDHEWRHKILKLYKQIIILGPSREKESIAALLTPGVRQRYLGFFEENAPKIKFAGYLLPEQEVVGDEDDEYFPKPPVPKGACRVAVVRGGGAYYPKLIATAILAGDVLGKEYYLTVVAGPSTTPQEWDLFSMLVGKKKINNVLLLRAVGDYEGLISRSDMCVSVAAYHSSVMLFKYRKKAVVVPFQGEGLMSFHEQMARANLLREMIGARILPMQELTTETLAAAVKDAAGSKAVTANVPKEWFTGGALLEETLTGLFER